MKRTRLLLSILTMGALAWAAASSWMLLRTGYGPLGMWNILELADTVTPEGVTGHYYRFHLHPLAVVGTFLPLGLVGAFWVWRWASPRRAPLP
ncbi:MAG TPA: hypothetical protein VFF64_11710 [Candidatus Eremiobacteraceae bacterium]|nr:hypothetical protein [Candidatus Eremiobacteraceae bacterium]